MRIRRLGRTGMKVSEVCLGTMTFGVQCDERQSFAILDKAVDHGVTFLDVADVYPVPMSPETAGRSEEIIGKWLPKRRDKIIVATKCRMRIGQPGRLSGFFGSSELPRIPAAHWHRVAAVHAAIHRGARGLRDLLQHFCLSTAGESDGAAIAAVL